jgi:GH15 family glucan-1,4-alpha-glucosidase
MSLRDRFLRWLEAVMAYWGRSEEIDKLVLERIYKLLDHMEDTEELTSADVDRYKNKIAWHIPQMWSNKKYIDSIAQLQQQEGEKQTQNDHKPTKKLVLRHTP